MAEQFPGQTVVISKISMNRRGCPEQEVTVHDVTLTKDGDEILGDLGEQQIDLGEGPEPVHFGVMSFVDKDGVWFSD